MKTPFNWYNYIFNEYMSTCFTRITIRLFTQLGIVCLIMKPRFLQIVEIITTLQRYTFFLLDIKTIVLVVTVGISGTGCFASYCLSKQGKMGINVGGYRFRFNGCARNGKVRWRCSRGPWCKAALHTFRGRIVYIQSTHNCGPKPPAL